MKTLRVSRLCAFAALIAALALPLSCKNPLSVSAGDGKTSLTIVWNLGSARTILPVSYPGVANYDVTLTPAAGDPIDRTGVTGDSLKLWDIPTGTYSIAVTGKDASGAAIVSGSASGVVLTGGQKSVTMTLAYITSSGKGRFHLKLDFASFGTAPDAVSLTLFDPSGAQTTPALSGSGTSYSLSGENMDAGAYRAVIKATAGTATAIRTESIVVFKELDSVGTVVFSKADFRVPPRAIGNTLSLLSGPGATLSDGSFDAAVFTNECANETMENFFWSYFRPLGSGLVKDGNILYVADRFANSIRKVDLSSGVVSTLAGQAGCVGSTDGYGSSARFEAPQGIVKLGAYLYVADVMNHTIRRVDPANGEVTTIAGSAGNTGSTDGDGLSARFWLPIDIATDGTSLFVADSGSKAIRKIAIEGSSYTVTTALTNVSAFCVVVHDDYLYFAERARIGYYDLTGLRADGYLCGVDFGFADSDPGPALFSNIKDMSTDGTYLYMTDGNAVRRMPFADQKITTVAGYPGMGDSDNYTDQDTGKPAVFRFPTALANGDGVLYVFDSINQVIKKIDLEAKNVSRVAGKTIPTDCRNGSAAASVYNSMGGIASDGTYLYVSESRYNTIRKVSIATGESFAFSGKPSDFMDAGGYADGPADQAKFNKPSGLVVAGDSLYVCDSGNFVVRKVKLSDGSVSTIAGVAGEANWIDGVGINSRFIGPRQIATDGQILYLIDTDYKNYVAVDSTDSIRSIDLETGSTRTVFKISPSYFMFGIATDGVSVFASEAQYGLIHKINILTGQDTQVAGASQSGFVDGVGTSAYFESPKGLATDGVYLYVCDLNNYAVRRILIDAKDVTTFVGKGLYPGLAYGSGGAARLRGPEYCVMVGSALYVTDRQTQSILKIQ